MGQWVLIIVMIMTVVYNTIVTHAILKNDVKHLKEDVNRMMQWVFNQTQK